MFKTISKLLVGLGLVLSSYSLALAGGSADNVLLVVNANKEDSKTIANHYIHLRNIPASHVLYVDWTHEDQSGYGTCLYSEFNPLLKTITDTIVERKLEMQTDYIVYSSDFPWQILMKGQKWEKPGVPIQEYATADDHWNSLNEETQASFVEFFGGGDLATAKAVVFTKHQEDVAKSKLPVEVNFDMSNSDYGSITGLTYLYDTFQNKNPAFRNTNINWYVPGSESLGNRGLSAAYYFDRWYYNPIEINTYGFRHNQAWNKPSDVTNDYPETQKYFLSVMLGVTVGPKNDQRGNTVDEVISYLTRSAGADATHPTGKFYFVKIVSDPPGHTATVRSRLRHLLYTGADSNPSRKYAVERLIDLGVGAQENIIAYNKTTNRMPEENDILGITLGTKWGVEDGIDLTTLDNSTLLPGAIVDNMTSYGGVIYTNKSPVRGHPRGDSGQAMAQPVITKWLKNGAAGVTGTICEPGTDPTKFPGQLWPEYYVKGASLAEALYQSISRPFQILILGDPLCQPWANPPSFEVEGLNAGETIAGSITIIPKATTAWKGKIRFFELHIDGMMYTRFVPGGKSIKINTEKLEDGYHEFRIVGVNADSAASQKNLRIPVFVDNNANDLTVLVSTAQVSASETLTLTASQTGATSIKIFQNYREIGEITGNSGAVTINASILGKGPTTIQAKSYGTTPAISLPFPITVTD